MAAKDLSGYVESVIYFSLGVLGMEKRSKQKGNYPLANTLQKGLKEFTSKAIQEN